MSHVVGSRSWKIAFDSRLYNLPAFDFISPTHSHHQPPRPPGPTSHMDSRAIHTSISSTSASPKEYLLFSLLFSPSSSPFPFAISLPVNPLLLFFLHTWKHSSPEQEHARNVRTLNRWLISISSTWLLFFETRFEALTIVFFIVFWFFSFFEVVESSLRMEAWFLPVKPSRSVSSSYQFSVLFNFNLFF